MSNKSQLQLNNIDLQSILSTVLGLPTQESCKSGLYVWKKYNYTPGISYTNPSFKMKATSGASKLVLNNCTFDCTKITDWKTFFDGFAYNTNVKLQNSTKFYWWVDSSTTYSISGFNVISSTSCELTLTSGYTVSSSYAESGRTYTYSGTKTISEEIKIFMEYVVSDSPTAYPDGGTQDGYWYEKVVEGITPEMFGYTKYAVDGFTLAVNSKNFTVAHSLEEVPKIAIIVSEDDADTQWHTTKEITIFLQDNYYSYIQELKRYSGSDASYATNAGKYSSNYVAPTTTAVSIYAPNYILSGKYYTLITMA